MIAHAFPHFVSSEEISDVMRTPDLHGDNRASGQDVGLSAAEMLDMLSDISSLAMFSTAQYPQSLTDIPHLRFTKLVVASSLTRHPSRP